MSAFYDLASLVLVPSGYKASKVYAQKPLTTDGQLTFSRASTATRVNSAGLIETVSSNVPRLDYSGGATCPKLLLEPQRVNYQLYSQDFTQWNLAGAATRTTGITDPAGGTTASRISNIPAGNISDGISLGSPASISSQDIRGSIYLKGSGTIGISLERAFGGTYFFFSELVTLTSTWTRYDLGGTVSSAAGFSFYVTNKTGSTATSVDVAFAQVEIGSYPTSYIPTTTAAVTRLGDICNKLSVSSLIGQTEGTIFGEFSFPNTTGGSSSYFYFSDGSFSNSVIIGREPSGGVAKYMFYINASGSNVLFNTSNTIQSGFAKLAIGYKSGSWAAYLNGALVASGTNSLTFGTMSRIGIGTNDGGITAIGDSMLAKQALLFKTRLTNAQLAELTAL